MLLFKGNSESNKHHSFISDIGDSKTLNASFDSSQELIYSELVTNYEIRPTDITISWSSYFSLLPNSLYKKDIIEEIVTLYDWPSQNRNFRDSVDELDISVVYSTSSSNHNKHITSLTAKSLLTSSSTNDEILTAVIFNNKLCLGIQKSGQIEVVNIFDVSNNDEILYYIMLYIQELQLNQEKLKLNLFGSLVENHSLKQNLSDYVRQIEEFKHSKISDYRYSGYIKLLEDFS